MTVQIYVLRFGGVLIVQSTQNRHTQTIPTVLVTASARDGIAKTQTRDGIAPARTP